MWSTDRPKVWKRIRIAGWLLLLLIGSGCTKTTLQPVEGKITYKDGSAMVGGGQITFDPLDPNNKTGARGNIRDDGSFRMGTYADADGVTEGKYRVAIVPPPIRNPNNPPPGWPPLDRKYMSHASSGLEFNVVSGRNTYNVVVEK